VSQLKAQLVELFRGEVPHVSQDMRATILITMALFLGMGLLGWLLVSFNPELASLFASDKMIKQVQISG